VSGSPSGFCIPVDLGNPGQFFACCGLLELADRLWADVTGRFDCARVPSRFEVAAQAPASLHDLLLDAARLDFDVGKDEAEDYETEDSALHPIVIKRPVSLVLDWWSEKSIKPWAGSMKERAILHAMLRAIDPDSLDPLNDAKAVFDPLPPAEAGKRRKKPEKREPFYFDSRRGSNAHPLDSGFSPDVHQKESICFPAVEAMCFVGLQRARPQTTGEPNESRYTVWTRPMPVNAIAPVVCGLARIQGSLTFEFKNIFRTDQRKHKCFARAVRVKE